MTSVSRLKDKARDYERKEDWNKAVDAYLQVIQATEKGDSEAELSLYNRVGDLYLRLGRLSEAVDYYSKAADRYGEAGLYNNAIALCNKALRYQPDRVELYRKLGKLSSEQGFVTDARRWYLQYAELLAKQGRTDDAFEALKEFATLSEDPEVRGMLAAQLESRGEVAEAVTQLRLAYTQYVSDGEVQQAEALRERILTLAPDLDPDEIALSVDGAAADASNDLPGMFIDRGGAGATATPAPAAPAPAPATPEDAPESLGVDEGYGFGEGQDDEEAAAPPLPGLDEGLEEIGDEVPAAEIDGLMATDMADEADREVLAADLPSLDIDSGAGLAGAEEAAAGDEESMELPPLSTLDGDEYAPGDADVEAAPLPGLEGFDEFEDAEEAVPDVVEDEEPLPMISGELAALDEEATGDEDLEPLPGFDLALDDDDDDSTDRDWEAGIAPPAEAAVATDWTLEDSPDGGAGAPAEVEEDAASIEDIAEVEDDVADEVADDEDVAEVEEIAEVEDDVAPEPLDVDAQIRAAQARFANGEDREALEELDRAHVLLADEDRPADAYRVAEARVRLEPDDVRAHQARVEYAFRMDDRPRLVDAYLDFAACLQRTGSEAKAESVFQRVLEIDPDNAAASTALLPKRPAETPEASAASNEAFIDLGDLLMDEEEETTRFVVEETVESGDEERDFAEMLSQFRAKVALHVPQEDTESHYDLGIAFKEMGLIDEAISEFQIALRGGNERLKVYEELGQCFMQKEQYNIAAKLLSRGAQLPAADDAELLGVYYQLGRCYEELGQKAEAREAYERVLGLDINFRDVNERLDQL